MSQVKLLIETIDLIHMLLYWRLILEDNSVCVCVFVCVVEGIRARYILVGQN